MPNAASVLPTTMMATTVSTRSGSIRSMRGSNSMPTETKNNTANASRSGSVSFAARWESSDSRMTMPAKNAPRAKLTPNSAAAPNAMPTAAVMTVRVNSSREPVRATCDSTHGTNLLPSTSISATNTDTLPSVIASVMPNPRVAPSASAVASPPSDAANAGNNTSTSTIARSSTMSQPTAM